MKGQYKEDRSSLPDIQRLKPIHYEILRLTFLTYSRREITQLLNVTEQTITNTINSTLGQQELNRLKASQDEQTMVLKQRIAEVRPRALKILVDDMERDEVSPAVRSSNAKFILGELGGLTLRNTPDLPNHLTPAQMETIKQLAIETRLKKDKRDKINNIEEVEYQAIN